MIVVIGSINLDLTATVTRLPAPGETVPGSAFVTAPGGKGANQALAAARAGAEVRMVGAVGKDSFAAEATALLTEAGVDLSSLSQSHASTGTALIMVEEKGENIIAVVPGANASVLPGDIAKAMLTEGDILLLQHEIPLRTVEAALDAAAEAGATSVLNIAPYRAEASGFAKKAAIMVANETEFDLYAADTALSGDSREARMKTFAAGHGKTAIVTLGADGVLVATPGDFFSVPAMKITPVDTVGAGDTFCGYLAAGLAEGLALRDAVRQASVAGSLACLKSGAQPSIPRRQEVVDTLAG